MCWEFCNFPAAGSKVYYKFYYSMLVLSFIVKSYSLCNRGIAWGGCGDSLFSKQMQKGCSSSYLFYPVNNLHITVIGSEFL